MSNRKGKYTDASKIKNRMVKVYAGSDKFLRLLARGADIKTGDESVDKLVSMIYPAMGFKKEKEIGTN